MLNMIVSRSALALCLAGAAIAVPASATVTFNSASVTTTSSVSATRGATTHVDNDTTTTSVSVLPGKPVQAAIASLASVKVGASTKIQSNASSTATIYFANAMNGSFDGSSGNSIVQYAASTAGNALSGFAKSGDYNFIYNFSTTTSALFSLDYILQDPNLIAGSKVTASLTGPSGSFLTLLTPNSFGSLSSMLTAGNYILQLKTGYEDKITRSGAGIGSTVGSSLDHFNFSVAPVPEPATWGMMIAGFAAVGMASRRSKRVTARAILPA